jgi:hypothetical protein
MNTADHDELREILGTDDAAVAAMLAQHKERRNHEVDHQARNLSVGVAQRLQKKSRISATTFAGALATTAAAVVIMISLNQTGPQLGDSPRAPLVSAPRVTASMAPAKPASASAVAESPQPTRIRKASSTATMSEEVILEQEAESQLVALLADAVTDETVWTITNEDVDKILQENSNDNGL